MGQSTEFLSPRMIGLRFENHSIPLEWLKDLSGLEQLILDLAKYFYLKDNPERQRIIKGFNKVALNLTSIKPGSAVPCIDVSYPIEQTPTLFPPEYLKYLHKARSCIINTINAASNDSDISACIPNEFIPHFEKFGRSLKDDEAIEFTPTESNKCRFDKTIRRKIIFASKTQQEIIEEAEVRLAVTQVSGEKKIFWSKLADGQSFSATYSIYDEENVFFAAKNYPKSKLLVKGLGKFSRENKIFGFTEIESISLLDPLDIGSQIDELSHLKDGWLDGKGKAPRKQNLEWLENAFDSLYNPQLPFPRLYPTPEGNVQAEWSTEKHEVSLEIIFDARRGEYQSLDINTNDCIDLDLDLTLPEKWEQLNQNLLQILPENKNE